MTDRRRSPDYHKLFAVGAVAYWSIGLLPSLGDGAQLYGCVKLFEKRRYYRLAFIAAYSLI